MILNVKTSYSKNEMADILGTTSTQGINRKLDRYGITYSTYGRGSNMEYYIEKMENPFKIFCITELGFDAQTDFEKVLFFYHYFLNDDSFSSKSSMEKEEIMRAENHPLSRQTIGRYETKLFQAGLFYRDNSECIYYFAYKKNRTDSDKETFNKAWREYYSKRKEGWDWFDSIMDMVIEYGGVARKQQVMIENAIYADKIEELNTLIDIQLAARIELGLSQTTDTVKNTIKVLSA